MTTKATLPGFDSPAVGFDQPFELLAACHERVQRSLNLLERLLAHIDLHGHDASSRSAAADVLRYFDVAAPHHHQDEELHVFPALADDAAHQPAIAQLQAEHQRMNAQWAALRPLLLSWRDEASPPAPSDDDCIRVGDYIALYADHIELEEGLIYPAAQRRLDAAAQAGMGAEMQSRRQS